MSRIAKKPIRIPSGVEVKINEDLLIVTGAKGTLEQKFLPSVDFVVRKDDVEVNRKSETKEAKALHGLYAKLLMNMIEGVSSGFRKGLTINGVGYRAELKGKSLFLNLGYSTQIEYVIPQGISIKVEGNTKLEVSGIDKVKVGQTAAEIRSLRLPEPYKGKGIRYEDEIIRRKVGKSNVKK